MKNYLIYLFGICLFIGCSQQEALNENITSVTTQDNYLEDVDKLFTHLNSLEVDYSSISYEDYLYYIREFALEQNIDHDLDIARQHYVVRVDNTLRTKEGLNRYMNENFNLSKDEVETLKELASMISQYGITKELSQEISTFKVKLEQTGKNTPEILDIVSYFESMSAINSVSDFSQKFVEKDPCLGLWVAAGANAATCLLFPATCPGTGPAAGVITILALECDEAQEVECTTCPNGYTYDGENCYSGVHFPSGYEGFIWNNTFYTSSNGTTCPNGFTYDGANCHSGLYFPGWEGFIWNNTFYLVPRC